ncbi:Cullin [Jimgerdemannia flammicorona]|uniref:Cullin n=1 Tax=Jimgerdemannia flammicorona TaxID=994334 RepID=A0A433QXA9_9FUNG|nr:Cullin [Jimgerdemannia flammicorona]
MPPFASIRPSSQSGTDQHFNDTWDRLAQAIREIYKKNASVLSFEELYRNAYNMVLHKCGDKLYQGVRDVITQHLEEVAREQIVPAFGVGTRAGGTGAGSARGASSDSGAAFLKVLKKVWEEHSTCMLMIRDILMYMDRVYVKTANVPLVYELGLDLFRDTVARSPRFPIQQHLRQVMLEQIQHEREGEVIDRSAVKSATDMLLDLTDESLKDSVYVADFEEHYLKTSAAFYKFESQMLVAKCDTPEYMKKVSGFLVEKRLNEEQERTRHYLSGMTEPKIQHIVEEELITNHVKTIMEMENSGLIPMLTNDKIDDLSRMYKLFSRVSTGLPEMRAAISAHIKNLGKDINANVSSGFPSSSAPSGSAKGKEKETEKEKDDEGKGGNSQVALRWVQEVLDLKDKFDRILEQAVNKDKAFQTAFNEAFERFINENPKSPEFISLFIDENLKKGLKGKTEEEIDTVLDKTITLFRFIQEKDVFERYYKQHLAKRLLLGRSVSDDAERGMIAKLKVECGYQFTTKLEGMFNDMRISTDTMTAFKDFLEVSGVERPKMDLGVTVLTSTFWPMNVSSSPHCVFSPELVKACQTFEKFYFGRHNGRRLTWQPNMGSADVKAQFKSNKKHEINVSTYAMVLLLLFNDLPEGKSYSFKVCSTSVLGLTHYSHGFMRKSWGIKMVALTINLSISRHIQELHEHTKINDADLKRTLQSLACAKYKVLTKEPKGKDVNTNDQFYYNADFTCPLARIKIQTVASKVESEGERKHTQEKVDEERKHQTEAAIVRIMKDRKTMEHNLLITEVTKQLAPRFMPSPSMIKKRIEALIDREYLERANGDR